MRFPCTIKRLLDGDWLARCVSPEIGVVEVQAAYRQATLDRLLSEVRYRLEWCPCSHLNDEEVEFDVTEIGDPIPIGR